MEPFCGAFKSKRARAAALQRPGRGDVLAVRLLRRRGRARRQLVNDTEAQTVARARIAELPRESYDELRARVGQPETTKVVDDSGTTYQVDVELFPRRSDERQPSRGPSPSTTAAGARSCR
jgi:hypothetical protein